MTKRYIVSVSDLNEKGMMALLSTALQQRISDLSDWSVFGPLIERFRVELTYTEINRERSARVILSSHDIPDEPWSASIDNASGNFMEWGVSPQSAIAATIIAANMRGEELAIPESQIEEYLRYPDEVERDDG